MNNIGKLLDFVGSSTIEGMSLMCSASLWGDISPQQRFITEANFARDHLLTFVFSINFAVSG